MGTVDSLLQIDFAELWIFLGDVLRNPTSNLTAFVLILLAITVLMLLLILIVLLVVGVTEEEPGAVEQFAESEFFNPDEPEESAAPVAVEAVRDEDALTSAPASAPPAAPARRISRLAGTALWLAIVAAVWVAGGWVSSSDTLCVSCHADDSIHTARLAETGEDHHDPVRCVACHESPNQLAMVTTAVPGRTIHFITGMVVEPWAAQYGTPVADSACAHCHDETTSLTTEDEVRGIRMSHAEPLAMGARCVTCHAPLPATGVIGLYTVGMDPCMRCHDAETAPAGCDYCHTKDVAFAMQARGEFTAVSHVSTLDCGGCHTQETCDACHGTRLPHTAAFMGAGHAREAVEDIWYNGGRMCQRCHTADRRPCTNCHTKEFPAHSVRYMPSGHQSADPYDNGCDQCHGRLAWDAQRNFCAVCHPRYAAGPGN
jgi:hypothetical protein